MSILKEHKNRVQARGIVFYEWTKDGLKFAAFMKWLKEEKKENQKLSNEIERRTGLKRGSRENLMCLSFFAGMDAGAEMLETLEAETGGKP